MTSQVRDRPQRLLLLPSSLSTMILYLLFPLLIIGIKESQTANMTEELSEAEGNQTFSVFAQLNSTMKPDNVTSSLNKDEMRKIEHEMQNNQTSPVIKEDDENFQNQEKVSPHRRCHEELLVEHSQNYCVEPFHENMLTISSENWCLLESIKRPYNDMTCCLEELSGLLGCYYPNPTTQDFFLSIHSRYFLNCTKEERLFEDAPNGLVMALTLIPVSLIPVLVYLVIWKSKVQD